MMSSGRIERDCVISFESNRDFFIKVETEQQLQDRGRGAVVVFRLLW